MCMAWVGCSQDKVRNEWLRFRPPESRDRSWDVVPPDRVRELAAGVRSEAVRILEGEAARPLDASERERFLGRSADSRTGSWYLIRAVKASAGTGRFGVHTSGSSVTVRYEGLSGSTNTEKSALLVLLPFTPSEVYVEISIAQ